MIKKITKHSEGYILEYCPDHPTCNKDGYVPQHRLVIEKSIERYISGTESIHHINHKRNDNRLENLLLCKNLSEHKKYDYGWKKINDEWFKKCSGCGSYLEVNRDNFHFRKNDKSVGRCKRCCKKYWRKYRDKVNSDKELLEITRKKRKERYKEKRSNPDYVKEHNRKRRELRRKKNEK